MKIVFNENFVKKGIQYLAGITISAIIALTFISFTQNENELDVTHNYVENYPIQSTTDHDGHFGYFYSRGYYEGVEIDTPFFSCCSCHEKYQWDGKLETLPSKAKWLPGYETSNPLYKNEFLYRVGNINECYPYQVFNGANSLTITNEVIGDVTYTNNKFSGSGIVSVCPDFDPSLNLWIEVVNGLNIDRNTKFGTYTTDKMTYSNITSNIVLLDDLYPTSPLFLSNGLNIFGNGFKIEFQNDIIVKAVSFGHGYIRLKDSNIDNIRLICPYFSASYLTNAQAVAGNCAGENLINGVVLDGSCSLTNSFITGARNAVLVASGDATLKNNRITYGTIANLQILTDVVNVTLENNEFENGPKQSTVNSPTKTMCGFGVLVMVNASATTKTEPACSQINILGNLIQHNFVCQSYYTKGYINSTLGPVVNKALSISGIKHVIEGTPYINMGFAFVDQEAKKIECSVESKIIDNRDVATKSKIPYSLYEVSIATGNNGYAYTVNNSAALDSSLIDEFNSYCPIDNSYLRPELTFDNITSDVTFSNEFDSVKKINKYSINIENMQSYSLDFDAILAKKYACNLNRTIKDSNNDIIKGNVVFTHTGSTEYSVLITDNLIFDKSAAATGEQVTYNVILVVNFYAKAINPPQVVANYSTSEGFYRLQSSNRSNADWTGTAPILQGISVTYYSASANDYKTIVLEDLTPKTKGTLSSNETWTYAEDDFTFTLSCGVINSKNTKYGRPTSVSVDGEYKMYGVVSDESGGFVTSGTGSVPVPVDYSFTANGQTITWSHKFVISRSTTTQVYAYTNFKQGTLKEPSSSCVTSESLITMADGSLKEIKDIQVGDMVMSWNFMEGKYEAVPVAVKWYHGTETYDILTLYFDNKKSLRIINDHGLFDIDLLTYVYINPGDVDEYIGHNFLYFDGDEILNTKLVSYTLTKEEVGCYSILTAYNDNFVIDGVLTITSEDYTGRFKYFNIDESLKYDINHMNEEIEKYGLYEYKDFEEYLTEEQFEMFNGKYFKVLVGRGVLTYSDIIEIIKVNLHN